MDASLPRQAAFATAVGVMAWVALYNGYPLVSWDSGAYLQSSFTFEVPLSRPVFYGLFLSVTHCRHTLWGVVLAQSILVTFSLRMALADAAISERRRALELVAVSVFLAIGTSLPWLTGQVMTDVFTGLCVLSLFQILFHPLSRRGMLAVGALLVFSLVVHFAHLPLAIALLAATQLTCRKRRRAEAPSVAWRRGWICVGIALLLVPSTNWLLSGRLFFSTTTHAFVLARLLSGGIVQKLLSEHCAERPYQLCPYQDDLPRSLGHYLWDPASPMERIGGWQGSATESWRMIRDCVHEYPGLVMKEMARAFMTQLGTFRVGADRGPFLTGTGINGEMQQRFRADYPHYVRSRQQRGQLAMQPLVRLHGWVLLFSSVASGVILLCGVRGGGAAARLQAFVWAAVILNAGIIAIFNVPNDRFGARMAWLVPFSVLAWSCRCARPGGLGIRARWRRHGVPPPTS